MKLGIQKLVIVLGLCIIVLGAYVAGTAMRGQKGAESRSGSDKSGARVQEVAQSDENQNGQEEPVQENTSSQGQTSSAQNGNAGSTDGLPNSDLPSGTAEAAAQNQEESVAAEARTVVVESKTVATTEKTEEAAAPRQEATVSAEPEMFEGARCGEETPSTQQNSGTAQYTADNNPYSQTLYVVNCNEWITLRSSASTSASSLAHMPLGACCTYLGNASNGFYKVSYNGQTGYALAQYLSTTKQSTGSTSVVSGGQDTTMYVVNCNEWITLRSSASTSASSLAHMPLGASCTYLGNVGNGFYQVMYNGQTGYALSQYLSTTRQSSNSAYSGSQDTIMYVVNCNEWITLRSSASTSASSLAHMPLGASCTYLGNAGNGFYKVMYNGQTGYALSQYLSTGSSSTSTSKTLRVVNCNEWITLRSSASTSASSLAHMPLGATCTYLGDAGNGFYKVKYNGQTGYALSQYLTW